MVAYLGAPRADAQTPQHPQAPPPHYPQQQYPQPQPYPPQPPPPQDPPPAPYPQPYPPPGPQGPPPPTPTPEPPPPEPPPPVDLPPTASGLYPSTSRYYSMPPEQEQFLDRRGLAIQVAGGAGGVFIENGGNFGVGYDVAIGGALSPNAAVFFNFFSLTYAPAPGLRSSHAIFAGALQVWMGKRAFFKIGAGLGQLAAADTFGFTLDAERGFAGLAALGLEVYQLQPDFAIDVQLRAAGGHYASEKYLINGAVLLGFGWY